MREWLQDYWWLTCGIVLAATFAFVQMRLRRAQPAGALPPVSFAAVRGFSVAELRPFFGTYRPTWREFLGYAVLVVWLGGMPALIGYAEEFGFTTIVLAGLGGATAAATAAVIDARSARVLGPDRIGFETPIALLSWSIPLSEVQQCDLVPGQPYNRLRVIPRVGNARSLPLPLDLWQALRTGSPN